MAGVSHALASPSTPRNRQTSTSTSNDWSQVRQNRKQETGNRHKEFAGCRFLFPVSCFLFPVLLRTPWGGPDVLACNCSFNSDESSDVNVNETHSLQFLQLRGTARAEKPTTFPDVR